MIKVSIIITCYNLENYISRSINSCLNQTMNKNDYEIIVVDDCSSDNSWSIIQNKNNIISIRHEINKGVGASTNTALKVAKGEYIIKVDGDDFIDENLIFFMSQILDYNTNIGFVYGDHMLINGKKEKKYLINNLDKLLDNGAGVMFRKKCIDILGGYSNEYRTRDDYDMMLRYIKNFDGYYLKLPYYKYFQREGSLSKQIKERIIEKQQIDKINYE